MFRMVAKWVINSIRKALPKMSREQVVALAKVINRYLDIPRLNEEQEERMLVVALDLLLGAVVEVIDTAAEKSR